MRLDSYGEGFRFGDSLGAQGKPFYPQWAPGFEQAKRATLFQGHMLYIYRIGIMGRGMGVGGRKGVLGTGLSPRPFSGSHSDDCSTSIGLGPIFEAQVLTVIAASPIPLWLPSGRGRLGRPLSTGREVLVSGAALDAVTR
jgi:hypothetical protein